MLLIPAALTFILTSCGGAPLPRLEVSSYTEKTLEVGLPLHMDIDCESGTTEVYSWNRKEVKLEFTRTVRGNAERSELEKRLEGFDIDVGNDRTAGKLALKTRFKGGYGGTEGVLDIKLYIPKKTSGFSLVQKSGRLAFLDNFNGDLDIKAGKLSLDINKLKGKLTCKLDSGDLRVTAGELESESDVLIAKGNIRIKASYESPGSYSFKTGFGMLELCLPENTNAVFDTYGLAEAADFSAGENPSKFRLECGLGKINISKF